MVSVPSFDPNTFIPSIKAKDWQALRQGRSPSTGQSRDQRVSAWIDIQDRSPRWRVCERIWPKRNTIAAAASVTAITISIAGSRQRRDAHGTIGLADAIKVSCDSFFTNMETRPASNRSIRSAKCLGIGEEIGTRIIVASKPAIMPGPEWMQIHHPQERWSRPKPPTSPSGRATCWLAAANGHGLRDGRERRHFLLSAAGRQGAESGWHTCVG